MDTKLTEGFDNEVNVKLQHCPSCQMPITVLKIQSFSWHITECMEVDRSLQKECSKGIHCDSTIVNHYLQETHKSLANYRSGSSDAEETVELPRKRIKLEPGSDSRTDVAFPVPVAARTSTAFDSQQRRRQRQSKWQNQPRITSYFTSSEESKYKKETHQRKITSFFKGGGGGTKTRGDGSDLPILQRHEVLAPKVEPSTSQEKTHTNSWPSRSVAVKNESERDSKVTRRTCPFYKKIPDTTFVVDAFSYGEIPGVSSYFLSHFHYDHYNGLTKNFKQIIYTSKVTANLVKLKIGVNEKYVYSLPLDESRIIKGVEVELVEANHCPGAVMFIFRLVDGRVFLHTGDFRAHPDMECHPTLKSLQVDILYLDTTYCDSTYTFPPQQEVLDATVDVVTKHLRDKGKTLIVCGSYTIGKERVFTAIAESLQLKVWANGEKWRILKCLEDDNLQSMLTENVHMAGIHVLSMMQLSYDSYLQRFNGRYDNILALKPTGWEYHGKQGRSDDVKKSIQFRRRDNITILGIPYSEHSSYAELERFVKFLKPTRIIATVNVAGAASQKQNTILNEWLGRSKQLPISHHFQKIKTEQ